MNKTGATRSRTEATSQLTLQAWQQDPMLAATLRDLTVQDAARRVRAAIVESALDYAISKRLPFCIVTCEIVAETIVAAFVQSLEQPADVLQNPATAARARSAQ